jgi:hypothetical protein
MTAFSKNLPATATATANRNKGPNPVVRSRYAVPGASGKMKAPAVSRGCLPAVYPLLGVAIAGGERAAELLRRKDTRNGIGMMSRIVNTLYLGCTNRFQAYPVKATLSLRNFRRCSRPPTPNAGGQPSCFFALISGAVAASGRKHNRGHLVSGVSEEYLPSDACRGAVGSRPFAPSGSTRTACHGRDFADARGTSPPRKGATESTCFHSHRRLGLGPFSGGV